MGAFFGSSSKTDVRTYYTTQTYDNAFNTVMTSSRTYDNVGNPVLNLGFQGNTGSSADNLLTLGMAGLLIVGGLILLNRSS